MQKKGDGCKIIVQRGLAAILGEVELIRLAYGGSDYLDSYLNAIERQAHKIFNACEKCKLKEVKHE